MSVVPPPMSMIMLPAASVTGRPDPIAAAIGSSTRWTSLALTRKPLSLTARRSTCVISGGTPMTRRGRRSGLLPCTLRHEVHQHLLGGVEVGNDAVLHRPHRLDVRRRAPEHLVSLGAHGLDRCPWRCCNATMDGSLRTMPRPRANTHVLAVPRSIATSVAKAENRPMIRGSGVKTSRQGGAFAAALPSPGGEVPLLSRG